MSNATCISLSSSAYLHLRTMSPTDKDSNESTASSPPIARAGCRSPPSAAPCLKPSSTVATIPRRSSFTGPCAAGLPQISRMTVHRILGTFVSLGLLSKTCHPGSSARFDPKLHQHHHLVCLDCGRHHRPGGPAPQPTPVARCRPATASRSRTTTFTFAAGVPAADKSPKPLRPSASALPASEFRGNKLNLTEARQQFTQRKEQLS